MRGVQILDLGGIYEGQIQVPVILAVVYEGSFQKLRGPSKGSSQTCCGPQMVDVGGYTQTRGPSRWMWVYPLKPPKFYSSGLYRGQGSELHRILKILLSIAAIEIC